MIAQHEEAKMPVDVRSQETNKTNEKMSDPISIVYPPQSHSPQIVCENDLRRDLLFKPSTRTKSKGRAKGNEVLKQYNRSERRIWALFLE